MSCRSQVMLSRFSVASESYRSHYASRKDMVRGIGVGGLVNFAIAACIVFSIGSVGEGFTASIITILSILIGFSYSVMTFVAANPFVDSGDPSDREQKLRAERLNGLVEKLFCNLRFFCSFAIILVVVSAIGIASSGADFLWWLDFSDKEDVIKFASYSVNFIFFFCLSEICREFFRILSRTNYIFMNRIERFNTA